MKFYAYIMDKDGKEPFGTANRLLFTLKTINGATNRCFRIFKGKPYKLFSYTNFYDDKTFREIT